MIQRDAAIDADMATMIAANTPPPPTPDTNAFYPPDVGAVTPMPPLDDSGATVASTTPVIIRQRMTLRIFTTRSRRTARGLM